MKHIRKFNESEKPTIGYEEALKWIKDNFSKEKVTEMYDEEINSGNWIDRDQMKEEGYESEYDYYIDYGRGEAEDAVIDQIIAELRDNFKPDFDVHENLTTDLKDEYDCL
jgi:hypothetical protein